MSRGDEPWLSRGLAAVRSGSTRYDAVPAEPADTGPEADLIRLNIAAPSAPDQIVHDGYRHALECAPPYLAGIGLYPGGVLALREAIARRYTDRGLPTSSEQVLVSSGAQHALRRGADLVVTCRGVGGPVLTADVVAPVAAERAGSGGGAGRPLVILAPHPDDETLGAGALTVVVK